MNLPRYQIFVSSTFRDLIEERRAVLDAILKLNQFPAGMEIFPAVNDTAWEHIEKVIKDSDYYVLLIGGKYGSIDAESGLSYTEKEYDFAVSNNIPVLAFTHSDEDSIPSGKVEKTDEIREKLKKFKQKVGNKHHWNYWKSLDELKGNVISSLSQSFVMNPQKGWVKAGGIEKGELLESYVKLQNKHDNLLEENQKLSNKSLLVDASKFSFGDEIFSIDVDEYHNNLDVVDSSLIPFHISWIELFLYLAEYLISKTAEPKIRSILNQLIHDKIGLYAGTSDEKIVVTSIRNQFLVLELIEIVDTFNSVRETIPAWILTKKGRDLYLAKVAQKSIAVETDS
jgi:Domain of unknown function (DUF4062)